MSEEQGEKVEVDVEPIVEDDKPRSNGGTHEVEEHVRVREGRPERVRAHVAKNPRPSASA